MRRTKQKWYTHDVHTGWSKSDPATTRRKRALAGHGGDRLATARGMQALSNVSRDRKTKAVARQDALFFFKWYKTGKRPAR